MKLCPQCEFIYEDDQSFCDMDGKELAYDPGPPAFEENVPSRSPELRERAAIPASLTAGLPASQPTGWQSRSSAVAALAAIILAALLFVVYYARTHQPRSGNANQASNQTSIQSSNQPTQLATAAQEPAPELASAPPASLTPLTPSPEQSPSASENVTTSSPSSLSISPAVSFRRGRIASNPVSASAADSRAPVVIWLTNGASIKADEVWERKEGIWYRQAGMVTFLKRSRVRAIQRLAAPNPRLKSTAINAEEKDRKPENAIAQNQPRVDKPKDVSAKKESRVGSFLKKTARILKRPFKF
jgi:hypothetical protein